jgi:putative methanogenesis marker protein 7
MGYGNFIFDGGSYKHERIIELIEDVGGYVITKRIFAQDASIAFSAPEEDYEFIKECARNIQGDVKESPLLGAEIAVVTPTLTRHHLPHPLCDIAEFLRRRGAQTNMIGLARGVGRRIAQLSQRERRLIEEHDVAVICLGNFRRCIEEKMRIFSTLDLPLVVTGLPPMEMDHIYIEKIGRMPYEFKRVSEIEHLKRIADGVDECVRRIREEISIDPPLVPPFVVKDAIEEQVEDVKFGLSPSMLTLRTNGLLVKMPFYVYADELSIVDIMGYKLGELSVIRPSVNRNRILIDLLPASLLD